MPQVAGTGAHVTAVALIGGDGAGKTTIAEHLTTTGRMRAKYMYMGISAQSGDRLLPTSRLVLWLRGRAYRQRVPGAGPTKVRIPADQYEYSARERGALWVAARLINRFTEAWYRQLVSWSYQVRGYVMIYDRHVLFDTGVLDPRPKPQMQLSERLFRGAMRSLFPRPDVVIFLDTPGDVLHARKGEASAEYLNSEARMYLAQAGAAGQFVRIDASLPLEEVKRQATEIVAAL